MINQYTLDRFEGLYAVLVDKGNEHNEMMVLKERLIAFAKEGDTLAIDFDSIGNLRHVEIIKSNNEESDIPEKELEGL